MSEAGVPFSLSLFFKCFFFFFFLFSFQGRTQAYGGSQAKG